MRWASYWLIYVTNGSIFVAKWSSSPRMSSRHGCPNQMWATGIMKQLLCATSDVLAWLPQSDVSNMHHEATPIFHVCCLSMVASIGWEQQVSWGYWRMILLASSVVSAWLPQSDLSNKDQQTVTLLQRMNCNQHITTLLCKGFIVVLEDCISLLIVFESAVLPNILETEHCAFFREYIVIFEHSFFTVGMQSIIFDNQ
jgi:hypothetical protein